ncbi:unnamed protein product [Boreogadus saida]
MPFKPQQRPTLLWLEVGPAAQLLRRCALVGLFLDCSNDGRHCRVAWCPPTSGLDADQRLADSGVGGGEESGMGGQEVGLSSGRVNWRWCTSFWLANIRDPGIVGLDLLSRWGARMDTAGAAITPTAQTP